MTLQNQPRGFYLELSDLTIVRARSEFHDLRMVVEWDHCIGDEEYEEVLAFYPSGLQFRHWSMWRTNDDITVQPTVGRTMHYTSVSRCARVPEPCRRRSGQSWERRPAHGRTSGSHPAHRGRLDRSVASASTFLAQHACLRGLRPVAVATGSFRTVPRR